MTELKPTKEPTDPSSWYLVAAILIVVMAVGYFVLGYVHEEKEVPPKTTEGT